MKYKLDIKSLLTTLIFLIIGFAIITFVFSFDFKEKKLSNIYYYSLILLFIAFAIYFILDRLFHYYKIEKKKFTIKKIFSQEIIYFNDIIYINEKKMNKGIIVIYDKTGKRHNIVLDKKKQLPIEIRKRCKNLISKDELLKLYPNIK